MRVGRSAIDEDAIRLLEQHNPDVQFDWTHILTPTPPAASAEAPRERGVEPVQGRGQKRIERRAFPRAAEPKPAIVRPAPEPVRAADHEQTASAQQSPARFDEPEPFIDSSAETVAEDVSGADEGRAVEFGPEDRASAAYQRLGSEGLARLRARYAEVMARIAERPMEDAAREELKLRAERLNPDGWVTTEEVQQALEQYEHVFEGVRALVGTRRRRRRRKSQSGGSEAL